MAKTVWLTSLEAAIPLARTPAGPPAQSDAAASFQLGENHLRRIGPTVAANFYSMQMDDLAALLAGPPDPESPP